MKKISIFSPKMCYFPIADCVNINNINNFRKPLNNYSYKFSQEKYFSLNLKVNGLILFSFIFLILNIHNIHSQESNYVRVKAKSGDGISTLLVKFGLDVNTFNMDFIKESNSGKFNKRYGLMIGTEYVLPIQIIKYNGTNIRTSINVDDYDFAIKVQNYNSRMVRKGLKSKDYRIDKELWLPLSISDSPDETVSKKSRVSDLPKNITEPLFGEKYKNVNISNHSLKDCIFYIVSGHGGIDPGAVGYKDGNELHEDEYAYDVSLRLAYKLLENGAEVYIIVQDPNDGIRDDKYLKNSYDEFHMGNQPIPIQQNERLSQRTKIINDLYSQNISKGKKQYCIETHVDSRYTGKKVDIFFYYKDGNTEGKNMAYNLMKTIKEKYEKAQPGRGYEGSVTSRGLYMLRNVIPTSVFIEIGNIQNPRDQVRIIEPNNRQAIANWLTDGIIYTISGKK
jgi:N-acetylmuramoyl-L-alanine amidase